MRFFSCRKMEEQNDKKLNVTPMIPGTWQNLNVSQVPKVKFEINIPQKISFPLGVNGPEERESDYSEGVYYSFQVIHEGVEKVMNVSAWTLLKGLKENEPLAGKTLNIVLKVIKGKQQYLIVPEEIKNNESKKEIIAE